MKKLNLIKYWILPLLAISVGMTACEQTGDDDNRLGEEGTLSLTLENNLAPIVKTKADLQPIYGISLLNTNGVAVVSYPDHTQMPSPIRVKSGTYTIRAASGSDPAAAFEEPYYAGETQAVVKSATNNTASITCYLANTKMTVVYSDEVKSNFDQYSVSVRNGDGSLTFGREETRAGYFRSGGTLDCVIDLVNKNGTAYQISHIIRDVKPREHYILNITLAESGGDDEGGTSPDITVDGSVNEKPHHIDVTLNKEAKPLIEGTGFVIANPVQFPEGTEQSCRIAVTANGRISAVDLAHDNAYLTSSGIPQRIDLIGIDASTETAVHTQGIRWSSPLDGEKTAWIDFTSLTKKLPRGEYAFNISVRDKQNQMSEQTLRLTVLSEQAAVSTLAADPWGKFATLIGSWNTSAQPEGIGFEYKKASDAQWTKATATDITADEKLFMTKVGGLDPSTAYEFRAVSASASGETASFETETAAQIPNMSFDNWCRVQYSYIGGMIKAYADYPNVDLADGNFWWDSGNKGANTAGELNPTQPETEHVVQGKAARLKTAAVAGLLAAGNVYTGSFGSTINTSGAKINFGRPYTSRPLRMTGYYDYRGGTIDKSKSPYSSFEGKPDSCHIYVVLTDWDKPFEVNTSTGTFVDLKADYVIAFGEFKSAETTSAYQPFTIDLRYRDMHRKPKYVLVVASASKYGDYFTGHVGSTLYLDEFAFEFE